MRLLSLLLVVLTASCREGSDGSNVSNLGLAAGSLIESEGLVAFDVPEFSQDETDLNGDGDVLDRVLHVYDFVDGSLTSLGLASELGTVVVGGVLVAFAVPEDDQGDTDLNGDGDTEDLVLHIYSAETGVTTNTGLAFLGAPSLGIASVAFQVFEAGQDAADLNGDADTDDLVLHVYDARTGLTTNTQRASTSLVAFHDHAFAFTTDEPSSAADLNGDGDATDPHVFELYDLLLGGVEQTPFALRPTSFLGVNVDDWLVLVDEEAQELDLNADGDELDGVWHQVDPHGAGTIPLPYSSLDSRSSRDNGTALALAAEEIDGLDANGDGDQLDVQAVLHDPLHDQTFASGLAVEPAFPFALTSGHMAFGVSEAAQDQDRNGDGDLADVVLHTMDASSGALTNHGQAIANLAQVGEVLVLWLDESEDGLDRNDDGDALDLVLTKFDPDTLLQENLGLASSSPLLAIAGTRALAAVSEAEQGRDLNGDGDTLDRVAYRFEAVFRIDPPSADFTQLPLAIQVTSAVLLADGRGLVLVGEADQDLDLNGDGDRLDAVLHRFQ